MKQAKVIALAALLPVVQFPAGANTASDDDKPPSTVTIATVNAAVEALRRSVGTLHGSVSALTASVGVLRTELGALKRDVQALEGRGVAVIRVIPVAANRHGSFVPRPRYFIMGSTIKGFHDAVAWGTEITGTTNGRVLPEGTYLIELRQPRPPADDAACGAGKPLPSSGALGVTGDSESNVRCRPMRILVERGSVGPHKLQSGVGVFQRNGTNNFNIQFKIPTGWVTTDRPVSSYAGSLTITKLK